MSYSPRTLHPFAISLSLCLCALSVENAYAHDEPELGVPQEVEPAPLPVLANFSPFELSMIGLATAGAATIQIGGHAIFGDPIPGMSAPHPRSVDWRVSRWANPEPDPDTQWLRAIPDLAGYVLPAGIIGYYSIGAVGALFERDFIFEDGRHEFIAFLEAFYWTVLTVNALKFTVGRQRPYSVRPDVDAEAFGIDPSEQNLSFPSGHSASAAAASFFLFHDLSDSLVSETLAEAHPVVRWGLGYALPLVSAAGMTWVVMYGRIRDQRHWLSDTLVGAGIGLGFSSFFYTMHFDENGEPRRRRVTDAKEESARVEHSLSPTFASFGAQRGDRTPMGVTYRLVF